MPSSRRRFLPSQRGITGLETAIILMAFVVVASIVAYTVISAGVFASSKSKDATTAGLDQVSNQLEVVGDVKADGQLATTLAAVDGTSGWTLAPGVTATSELSDYKTGSAALKLNVGGSFTSGLIASTNLASPVDLSHHFAGSLWIKATSSVPAGTLQMVIDDTPGCGSPEETLSIPALAANTWTKPRIKLSDPSALTAVACVGIAAPSDPGSLTMLVDQFEGPPEVQAVHVQLSNALKDGSVSFQTSPDSNGDGLLSDEPNAQNHLVVSFINNDTVVRDLAWTYTPLGISDGDSNLEYGETFQLNIDLRAVDPIPTTRSLIGLDIEPYSNAVISLQKLVPSQLSRAMVLR